MRRLRLFFSSLLVGLLLAFATLPAGAALLPSDKAVLEDLYNSTNGAGWTRNDNWMNGDPCANNWYGITCNATGTRVIDINLSSNNLAGTLPPTLSPLTALKKFLVHGNYLTDSIPDLSGLSMLETFYVDSNQFTGSIPNLSELTALEFFDVSLNQLTGSIPSLTGLTKLNQFFADGNLLGGPIPSLSGLTNLRVFDVQNNQLTGSIPSLSAVLNLTHFRIQNNQLTGTPPAAPSSLYDGYSILCPNFLRAPSATDAAWNAATGTTPWNQDCTAGWPVIVFTGEHGSSDKFRLAVIHGTRADITLTPDPGYVPVVSGSCGGVLSDDNVFTTQPITQACNVMVFFREKAGVAWEVTVTAGPNGSADTGTYAVAEGAAMPINVTPDPGYVPVVSGTCGGVLSDGGNYTTAPVTQDCTVEVSFQRQEAPHPTDRVTPIPTLSEWALLLLALLLGGFGWRQVRLRGH